jgi:hypothetical protein
VASGYGGIRQASPVSIPDIGAGWTVLTADSTSVVTPRFLTQSFAANGIAFNLEGVWSVSLGFSISHNESQQSRSFSVRLFNVTEGTAGNETVVGVGRNTDTTTFSVNLLVEMATADVGDLWRVELGGTLSSITGVTENSFSFLANLVSEYRGGA